MFRFAPSVFRRPHAAKDALQEKTLVSLKPEQRLYAIGDLHGCSDAFDAIFERIRSEDSSAPVVCVGDYVDRGPASAKLLCTLFTLQNEAPEKFTCLMGNHERMMLDFIDDPVGRGARWLDFGGLETVKSFGITHARTGRDLEESVWVATALQRAMPLGMLDWLRDLPLSWSSGNVYCVHAAMDPSCAPDCQKKRHLIWGHPYFHKKPATDGRCVVHGHTTVREPEFINRRIAIDTGAYRTGRLTAARIDKGALCFLG